MSGLLSDSLVATETAGVGPDTGHLMAGGRIKETHESAFLIIINMALTLINHEFLEKGFH